MKPQTRQRIRLNALTLLLILVTILGVQSRATERLFAQQANNSITIETKTVAPGENGSFSIALENVEAVASGQIRFTYDATFGLDITGVAVTNRIAGFSVNGSNVATGNPALNAYQIIFFNLSNLTIAAGSGAILTVSYTIDNSAAGSTPLTPVIAILSDPDANSLSVDAVGGAFSIVGAATPTTTPITAPTETVEPTATPTVTPTATVELTATPTETAEPTATETDVSTNTPTPTEPPTSEATSTATATNSPVPSDTPVPTATPTVEPTATATATPTPTSEPTATLTNTLVPSNTPVPTVMSTVEPTATTTLLPTIPPTSTPTQTAMPTVTSTAVPPTTTATATTMPETERLYVSVAGRERIGDLRVQDEDILQFDPGTNSWTMIFDGSNVGLGHTDVDAFHLWMEGNAILLSFDRPIRIPDLGWVDDSDIVTFLPTTLGEGNTRGTFALFFDGSTAGLTTGGEDIDAIGFGPDGKLVISTKGTARVPGNGQENIANDEDILMLNSPASGPDTEGMWSLYFDGSDINLEGSREDVNGLAVNNELLYLTTKGSFRIVDHNDRYIEGKATEVFLCVFLMLGDTTSCELDIAFDHDQLHLDTPIDGLSLAQPLSPTLLQELHVAESLDEIEPYEVAPDDFDTDDPELDLHDINVEETLLQLFLPLIAR